jgi:phospholipid transport system substrate-binding protein
MLRSTLVLLASVLAVVVASRTAQAAPPPPDQFVQSEIDRFQKLLALGSAERMEGLRKQVRTLFDFEGFSKATVAQKWDTLSPDQQKGLRTALQELIESRYLQRPEVFDKRKVAVGKGEVSGQTAKVTATISHKDADITIEIEFRLKNDAWVVADVTVDDLSMLDDYRTQFTSFLQKKTPDELIAKLKSIAAGETKKK